MDYLTESIHLELWRRFQMVCKICKVLMYSGTHYENKKGKMIARRYDECPRCHFCQYNNRNNSQEKK